jgi:hypothetical protein
MNSPVLDRVGVAAQPAANSMTTVIMAAKYRKVFMRVLLVIMKGVRVLMVANTTSYCGNQKRSVGRMGRTNGSKLNPG